MDKINIDINSKNRKENENANKPDISNKLDKIR